MIPPSYGSFAFAFNCPISRKTGVYYRYFLLPISFLLFSLEPTLIRLFCSYHSTKTALVKALPVIFILLNLMVGFQFLLDLLAALDRVESLLP